MTRFAWLQSRTQTVAVSAVLAVLAVVAIATGLQLSHLYDSQVAGCRTGCDLAINDYLSRDAFLQHTLDIVSLLAPAVLGVFWGAPLLARELETGTYRVSWTQSVSRSRWLWTKLGFGAVTTAAAAGALTLIVTWWSGHLDRLGSNRYDLFDRRGIAPVGYSVFAFAIGALLGAVIRRVLPAMAATLAAFVAARVSVDLWVRPRLLPPLHKTVSLLDSGGFGFASTNGSALRLVAKGSAGQNTWTLSSQIVTTDGHRTTTGQLAAFVQQYCPAITRPPSNPVPVGHPVKASPADAAAFETCRQQAARTYQLFLTYQPAHRYWTLQWLETGVYVLLAALALAGCAWWVTRRTR